MLTVFNSIISGIGSSGNINDAKREYTCFHRNVWFGSFFFSMQMLFKHACFQSKKGENVAWSSHFDKKEMINVTVE